jgi:hypothetical protein
MMARFGAVPLRHGVFDDRRPRAAPLVIYARRRKISVEKLLCVFERDILTRDTAGLLRKLIKYIGH